MKYVAMVLLFSPGSHKYKIYGPFDTASEADRWLTENSAHGHEIIEIHEVSAEETARLPSLERGNSLGSHVARTFSWERKRQGPPKQPPPA